MIVYTRMIYTEESCTEKNCSQNSMLLIARVRAKENKESLESVPLFNSIGNIPRHVYLPVKIHRIYKRPKGI